MAGNGISHIDGMKFSNLVSPNESIDYMKYPDSHNVSISRMSAHDFGLHEVKKKRKKFTVTPRNIKK